MRNPSLSGSINRQIRLAARPSGLPKRSGWRLTEESAPVPGAGDFVVANSYLSVDPAMRRWINATFRAPVAIGEVMEASAVGRVAASRHPGFAVGDQVSGGFGIQDFACSDGTGVTLLDPLLAPLPAYLGALATTGLTAYFGSLEIGRPRDGDTVVVSGAAGATGSIAGQIARIKACRSIGIAAEPRSVAGSSRSSASARPSPELGRADHGRHGGNLGPDQESCARRGADRGEPDRGRVRRYAAVSGDPRRSNSTPGASSSGRPCRSAASWVRSTSPRWPCT